MGLNERNKQVWQEIERWETTYFSNIDENHFYSFENNFNKYLETWCPKTQKKILESVDSIIFHTHAIIQNSKFEQETMTKVLDQGRVFTDIKVISDMKKLTIDQLRYITNQHLAKQRLLAFTQGGIAGIGSFPLLALDLPLLLLLNLRSIQLTAMTYGYDLRTPFEMMLAVNLFHASTLPKTFQKQGWDNLLIEAKSFENEWLVLDEEINHQFVVWLQQPIKQLAKGIVLFLLRKKLVQGIPLVGISVGAATNYFLAKQISQFAHHFYQKRYLIEQMKK